MKNQSNAPRLHTRRYSVPRTSAEAKDGCRGDHTWIIKCARIETRLSRAVYEYNELRIYGSNRLNFQPVRPLPQIYYQPAKRFKDYVQVIGRQRPKSSVPLSGNVWLSKRRACLHSNKGTESIHLDMALLVRPCRSMLDVEKHEITIRCSLRCFL